MRNPLKMPSTTAVATLAALLVIAFQIGGKAVRDALFFSIYEVTALPFMLVGSSLVSLGVILIVSRAMTYWIPARFVPVSFLVSGALLLAEWFSVSKFPAATAALFYLHIAALGSVLISGFWSMINERFDPRTARRSMSRIATGATLGGLLGGLLAERVGSELELSAMFPVLAFLHFGCALLLSRLAGGGAEGRLERQRTAPSSIPKDGGDGRTGLRFLWQIRHLRHLALFLFLITLSAAFVDYLFKAATLENIHESDDLVRFFAIFYTATGVLTFLVQLSCSHFFLHRFGLGKTAAVLPMAVTVGSFGALLAPGLFSLTAVRGAESVFRNSLFRSSYELFYTPVPEQQKRSTKSLIDVGSERLGDVAGGLAIRLLLFLGPFLSQTGLLVFALGSALTGVVIAFRLQKGYVALLEQNLFSQVPWIEGGPVQEKLEQSAFFATMGSLGLDSTLEQGRAGQEEGGPLRAEMGRGEEAATPDVDGLGRLKMAPAELHGEDAERVRQWLRNEAVPDFDIIPHVIPMLGREEVYLEATRFLVRAGESAVDSLIQAFLQSGQPVAVRRRIPRILSLQPLPKVVEALMSGFEDHRFEVRYQCAVGLARMKAQNPSLKIPRERIFRIINREVSVDRSIWESYRLLDRLNPDECSEVVDERIRNRVHRGLEHVFTLLSLILPSRPLRIALMGIYAGDGHFRGTALEYLEHVLPEAIRVKLLAFLEVSKKQMERDRSREEILEDLFRTHDSIILKRSGRKNSSS